MPSIQGSESVEGSREGQGSRNGRARSSGESLVRRAIRSLVRNRAPASGQNHALPSNGDDSLFNEGSEGISSSSEPNFPEAGARNSSAAPATAVDGNPVPMVTSATESMALAGSVAEASGGSVAPTSSAAAATHQTQCPRCRSTLLVPANSEAFRCPCGLQFSQADSSTPERSTASGHGRSSWMPDALTRVLNRSRRRTRGPFWPHTSSTSMTASQYIATPEGLAGGRGTISVPGVNALGFEALGVQVVMCSNCGRTGVLPAQDAFANRNMFLCRCGGHIMPATPAELLAFLTQGMTRQQRGVSAEVLDLLPLVEFGGNKAEEDTATSDEILPGGREEDDTTSCRVCLGEYEKGSKLRIMPCFHKFHKECIDEWLLERSTLCPLCNISVDSQSRGLEMSISSTEVSTNT